MRKQELQTCDRLWNEQIELLKSQSQIAGKLNR